MRMLIVVIYTLTLGDILLADAACLLPGGIAGSNAGYQYAVAHINGLIYADMATDKLDPPKGKLSAGPGGLSEQLTNTHLAASNFECAAREVKRHEKITLGASDQFSQQASMVARDFSTVAGDTCGKLVGKSRTFGSLLEQAMRNSLSETEFTIRLAKETAEYQELLSNLMLVSQGVTSVLVDGQPDSTGHMSRLRITAKERADLVQQIDTAFDKRAQSSTDQTLPYIDASVTILRGWLTRPGYTPRP